MIVDFFTQGNKKSTKSLQFGICDDSTQFVKKPAYIDESDSEKWIAEVHNNQGKPIDFYAIDCCVKWYLENGDKAKVCDGMLSYNEKKNIVFVELKDRNPGYKSWRKKAEEQLKSTIAGFRKFHNTEGITIKAYACNKQALLDVGEEEYLEKFKDETKVTLRVFREIEIS